MLDPRKPPPLAEACATEGSLCGNVICCYADAYVFAGLGECRVTGNPRRILLTGGAGFIGSHLALALLRK